MNISSSPGTDDRSFPPMGSTTTTTANSFFPCHSRSPISYFDYIYYSLGFCISQWYWYISSSNSAAVVPIGTSVLRRRRRSYPFLPIGTQWNGYCAKFLGCQWTARPNCRSCNALSCPMTHKFVNATIVDRHHERRSGRFRYKFRRISLEGLVWRMELSVWVSGRMKILQWVHRA